jgi:molecular chaperone DnaK
MNLTLTRAKLEQLIAPLVERSLEPCRKCLADAKLKASDIDQVVLVGGSTRIPMVQEAVKKFFGKEPNRSVNPDEVVALGAAVQGGVLAGDVKDLLLLDVTPLSLGIETLGGVNTVLIPRNTTIPTKKSEVFSTASDNQTSVEVHVLQGEREMAKDNRTLGRFHLDGIPPAPRGMPQIEVTFDIDANGIVNVSAKDKATGKAQHITITASSGLSEAEIQRMVKDAEAHAAEDKKRREVVEEHNKLDSMIYNIEKMLAENGDKLSADAKAPVEAALKEAKSKLDSQDLAVLKVAHENLTKASHKMAEELYKASSAQPNPAAAGADDGAAKTDKKDGGDDVVDAEFEEAPRN